MSTIWLNTEIESRSTKGAVSTTQQTALGSTTETSTRPENTVTRSQIALASNSLQITQEDVGIAVSFDIYFQNKNPVSPDGTGTDPC